MSDPNKNVIRRLYEEINQGHVEILEELVADDLIEHEEFPGLESDKAGVIQFFRQLRAAFPDLRMTADDFVAEGDKVVIRGTMTGTHEGEFMGIEATGNRISVPFADFFRLEDGQIAEHWGATDTGVMMQQLGVMGD